MRRAFSLVEVVIAVVVIGVLAGVLGGYFKKDDLALASAQVASDIAYTQYLALTDDRFDSKSWYKSRWQIAFSQSKESGGWWTYSIFSDSSSNKKGNPDMPEIAVNPRNPATLLTGGVTSNKDRPNDPRYDYNLRIGQKFSIANVEFFGECAQAVGGVKPQRLAFDELGRPYKGKISSNKTPFDDLMSEPCKIMLAHKNGERKCLFVAPFSGKIDIGECG